MSQVKNFHEIMPKKYRSEQRTYPAYDEVRIKLDFRMLIIGATGSGKTNLFLNIFSKISAWDKIVLIAKNIEEPLYQYFIDQIRDVEEETGMQILTVGTSIDDIPLVDSFKKTDSNLLIIDDMISEKQSKLENIKAIFVRGRKQHLSTIFISQSYFKIPLMIRQNSDYIVLKKIASVRDLTRIASEFTLDKPVEEIIKMYKDVSKGGLTSFFMIDLEASDPHWRFRDGYT